MSRSKNQRGWQNNAKKHVKEEYRTKSRARWREWLARIKKDPDEADEKAQPKDLECANYWNWD